VGCYIWYSEEGTALLYKCPLVCSFDVPIKELEFKQTKRESNMVILRDLHDFLNKPRHSLKTMLGNAGFESVKEDAVVRLWQLNTWKQVGNDALKQ